MTAASKSFIRMAPSAARQQEIRTATAATSISPYMQMKSGPPGAVPASPVPMRLVPTFGPGGAAQMRMMPYKSTFAPGSVAPMQMSPFLSTFGPGSVPPAEVSQATVLATYAPGTVVTEGMTQASIMRCKAKWLLQSAAILEQNEQAQL